MRFEFASAGRILFGPGAVRDLAAAARGFGGRALLVAGAHPERVLPLCDGLDVVPFAVPGEPTIEDARRGRDLARAEACDLVIAIGGGSALDAGKAIAALLANPGDPLDYLEVVGRGQPLTAPSVPCIAVPTTAGTGSEVTRNAVLASPEHGAKASLRSAGMLPRLALVDPELTYDLPPAITAATGLDALTQLIEPYVSSRANPMVDAICRDGIPRAARALPRAFFDPGDRDARASMALASLSGGLALANAGLGAVHGFAAPIGGSWTAPHGAVCAALLPHVMRANIAALRRCAPDDDAIRRYREVAVWLTANPGAIAEDGADRAAELCRELAIPPLSHYGITSADIPSIVEKAARASSMKANPVALETTELAAILEAAL